MKATITANPIFYLTLDKEIVSILMRLANNHYDFTCKQAGKYGGLLYGWRNCVEHDADCQGTFRDLDLTLKICELANPAVTQKNLPMVKRYCNFVRKLLKQSQQLCDIQLEAESDE